jgi:hypothetical protein
MSFDPTRFAVASVVDTCAVWNMLSSLRLNEAAIQAKLHFCITPVVLYECLYKPRPCITWEQQELMDRLESNRAKGRFQTLECSLDDLLTISEKVPGDSDHDQVIDEHERFERRPLTEFFNKSYAEAMRCRLMVRASPAAIADQQAGQGV